MGIALISILSSNQLNLYYRTMNSVNHLQLIVAGQMTEGTSLTGPGQ